MPDTDLRYPIGPVEFRRPYSPEERKLYLAQLAEAPLKLRSALRDLSDSQLDTPYRPEGWTVRQVVHHLPDGQMQWYVQARRALVEDLPLMSGFHEAQWAELPDARTSAIEPSLRMFDGIQARAALLFESLSAAEAERAFQVPGLGALKIADILPVLAWHARHHTAHITELRLRKGWFKPE